MKSIDSIDLQSGSHKAFEHGVCHAVYAAHAAAQQVLDIKEQT